MHSASSTAGWSLVTASKLPVLIWGQRGPIRVGEVLVTAGGEMVVVDVLGMWRSRRDNRKMQ